MARFFERLFGSAPEPVTPAKKPARINAYQAVSVIACGNACRAALDLGETRLLAKRAPSLPLANCDRPQTCSCRFKKYEDRRTAMRRTPYASPLGITAADVEKRFVRDRRANKR
jgi:hypothetical protein